MGKTLLHHRVEGRKVSPEEERRRKKDSEERRRKE
jgi:hypothetical protein